MCDIHTKSKEIVRKQLRDQVPEGLYLLSEQIISGGKPVIKAKQTIAVEAEFLEEARERIKPKASEGLELLSETIILEQVTCLRHR